jgi:hypothetical protein
LFEVDVCRSRYSKLHAARQDNRIPHAGHDFQPLNQALAVRSAFSLGKTTSTPRHWPRVFFAALRILLPALRVQSPVGSGGT